MIAAWLAGKASGLIIFCIACLSIPLAIFGTVEAVELHGASIPFPIWGPIVLADGALGERDKAVAARDQALKDEATWQGNATRLSHGLDQCNASVTGLAAAGKKMQDAAQVQVDQALARIKVLQSRAAAVAAVKSTDEKCPAVDQIFSAGFGQ